MSFPTYPAYRDSGVDWLGEVPLGWRVGNLKHALIELVSGGTPESNNSAYWSDGDGIPWVAISDMTRGPIVDSTAKSLTEAGLKSKGLRVIPAGGLLYSIYASIGKVAVLGLSAATNQAILGLLLDSKVAKQGFVKWWLVSLEIWVKTVASSNTQDNLNAEKVRNLPLVFPSLLDQAKIARFLDHETARIDTLIEEQQRLIELLKEKRQAVISHAVTKGLDPTAPMKDSGVEWLGEVPAHWQMAPLKYSARVVGRIGFRGYTTDDIVDEGEGALTLSPSNMVGGSMNFDKSTYISWDKYHESPEIQLRQGDVVLVKTGSTYGRVAYVDHLPCATTINPQLAVFKAVKFESKFLFYLFESAYLKSLTKNSNTGGTMPTMTQENIGNYKIPMPGDAEMELILRFIEAQVKLIEDLVNISENSVSLLNERRSALISAAVTGKIDVRGWQPPASTQAAATAVAETV
ncbi:restriction endonuclease subunit S [Stutzerimonas stutzeri]|uniref:restriction endonuclease subunit S n=1 Tax=Stutzerimonas stutzeri TaxID=316 RepID=UPI001BD191D4|nr:restriction endonuclease subunit S [Stutzerimonas stutzeri]